MLSVRIHDSDHIAVRKVLPDIRQRGLDRRAFSSVFRVTQDRAELPDFAEYTPVRFTAPVVNHDDPAAVQPASRPADKPE